MSRLAATHPIEEESYRLMEKRVDLTAFGPLSREVVARIVHATADTSFAETMVMEEATVERAVAAIRSGAPIVCDSAMTQAGIVALDTFCFLSEARAEARAAPLEGGLTLSARAIEIAAERHPVGAIVVVGCAPTALFRTVELASSGKWRPSLVVGLPVGFVGAAESKSLLRSSKIPSISNIGERGGSPAAAAAVNAMARLR